MRRIHTNLSPNFYIINLPSIIGIQFIDGVGENIVTSASDITQAEKSWMFRLHITKEDTIKLYVGKLDCHNFATMHSCTPSNNCMTISRFYILLIDYGRQVYY